MLQPFAYDQYESLPDMGAQEARDAGLLIVPLYATSDAQFRFRKLAKRATGKLRLATAPTLEYVAKGIYMVRAQVWNDGEVVERSRPAPCVFAMVQGEAPKIAGWHLAARLQRLATGERLVQAVPGIAVPERFRHTGYECEHCHASRMRNDCFVLAHESGEFKQVGRTCLKDFLGHDPRALLASYTAIAVLRDSLESEFMSGLGTRPLYDTLSVLCLTAAAIRVNGWCSRQTAKDTGRYATADQVQSALISVTERAKIKPTAGDETLARATLVWVRDELAARSYGHSEYESNLIAALKQDTFDSRAIGVACSAVAAYQRELSKRQAREADKNSQYVGAVKARLRDMRVTWFASGCHDVRPGHACSLTGTVKGHREYQGVKETQLSRCVLA